MKKKIFVITSIVLVIALVGVFGTRFCVNYFFDRFFLKTTLSSVLEDIQSGDWLEEKDERELNKDAGNEVQEVSGEGEKGQNKKKLSNTEVIARVMKSAELTKKMASMIPYEEKRTVIRIILSNFTEKELAEIAKNISKGLTPEEKSKMISLVRSRFTDAQWRRCLDIAYKYVDQMRPYVE